ncbi:MULTISPECIES: hypothetical protein [unclassified Lentilitoribacter]|uniref:hypothetical protein n=1 Tax=unclassified Lentilitoribacter TaxID=2647570 RepID=UPI0013A6DABB|nr:hypothetical protein [Lentilitoribacter sp. Alg239-R112]
MTKQNHKPTHEIFHVVGENDNARWTKIGVAWQHKDGEGMNLAVNYTPLVEGKMVVRKIKIKTKEAA